MPYPQKQKFPFEQSDDWFVIAKSNTVNFKDDATNNPAGYALADIYVGGSGDVSLTNSQGVAINFKAVPIGRMRVSATRVNSTGTTATDMVGLVSGTGMGI